MDTSRLDALDLESKRINEQLLASQARREELLKQIAEKERSLEVETGISFSASADLQPPSGPGSAPSAGPTSIPSAVTGDGISIGSEDIGGASGSADLGGIGGAELRADGVSHVHRLLNQNLQHESASLSRAGNLTEVFSALREESKSYSTSVSGMQEEIAARDAQLSQAHSLMQQARSQWDSLQQEKEQDMLAQMLERGNLHAVIQEHAATEASLRKQLFEVKSESAAKYQTLQNTLKEELATRDHDRKSLETSIRSLQSQLAEARSAAVQWQRKQEAAARDLSLLQVQFSNKEQEHRDASYQSSLRVQSLSTQLAAVEKKMQGAQSANEKLRSRVEEMKSKLVRERERTQAALESSRTFEQQVSSVESLLTAERHRLQTMTQEKHQVERKLLRMGMVQSQNEELRGQLEKMEVLRDDLKKREEVEKRLSRDLERTNGELKVWKDRYQQVTSGTLKDCKDQVARLESQVDLLRSSADSLGGQLAARTQEAQQRAADLQSARSGLSRGFLQLSEAVAQGDQQILREYRLAVQPDRQEPQNVPEVAVVEKSLRTLDEMLKFTYQKVRETQGDEQSGGKRHRSRRAPHDTSVLTQRMQELVKSLGGRVETLFSLVLHYRKHAWGVHRRAVSSQAECRDLQGAMAAHHSSAQQLTERLKKLGSLERERSQAVVEACGLVEKLQAFTAKVSQQIAGYVGGGVQKAPEGSPEEAGSEEDPASERKHPMSFEEGMSRLFAAVSACVSYMQQVQSDSRRVREVCSSAEQHTVELSARLTEDAAHWKHKERKLQSRVATLTQQLQAAQQAVQDGRAEVARESQRVSAQEQRCRQLSLTISTQSRLLRLVYRVTRPTFIRCVDLRAQKRYLLAENRRLWEAVKTVQSVNARLQSFKAKDVLGEGDGTSAHGTTSDSSQESTVNSSTSQTLPSQSARVSVTCFACRSLRAEARQNPWVTDAVGAGCAQCGSCAGTSQPVKSLPCHGRVTFRAAALAVIALNRMKVWAGVGDRVLGARPDSEPQQCAVRGRWYGLPVSHGAVLRGGHGASMASSGGRMVSADGGDGGLQPTHGSSSSSSSSTGESKTRAGGVARDVAEATETALWLYPDPHTGKQLVLPFLSQMSQVGGEHGDAGAVAVLQSYFAHFATDTDGEMGLGPQEADYQVDKTLPRPPPPHPRGMQLETPARHILLAGISPYQSDPAVWPYMVCARPCGIVASRWQRALCNAWGLPQSGGTVEHAVVVPRVQSFQNGGGNRFLSRLALGFYRLKRDGLSFLHAQTLYGCGDQLRTLIASCTSLLQEKHQDNEHLALACRHLHKEVGVLQDQLSSHKTHNQLVRKQLETGEAVRSELETRLSGSVQKELYLNACATRDRLQASLSEAHAEKRTLSQAISDLQARVRQSSQEASLQQAAVKNLRRERIAREAQFSQVQSQALSAAESSARLRSKCREAVNREQQLRTLYDRSAARLAAVEKRASLLKERLVAAREERDTLKAENVRLQVAAQSLRIRHREARLAINSMIREEGAVGDGKA